MPGQNDGALRPHWRQQVVKRLAGADPPSCVVQLRVADLAARPPTQSGSATPGSRPSARTEASAFWAACLRVVMHYSLDAAAKPGRFSQSR